jgi:hypothetical protein
MARKPLNWIQTLWKRHSPPQVSRSAQAQAEREAGFTLGAFAAHHSERDRLPPSRQEVLEQCLEAWRVNPLARRIVSLTSQYVIGGGLAISCPHRPTAAFLERFWNHPLNRMTTRTIEWCDELTRSGNLFVLVSTDAAGMSYARAVPAAQIAEIEAAENDIEQPLAFYPKAALGDPAPQPWTAFSHLLPPQVPAMLHYTINRPAGAQWGESDLAPLLRWLARYANWLEDRARLNRYRNAFLFVVKGQFTSEGERAARQHALNLQPPPPGSILVTDAGESWEVLSPRLESQDAVADGLALKKMIAAGVGIPLHFLAEPESATRTTAEAAGGATYRYFEQRQKYFTWLIGDLLRAVVWRAAQVAGRTRSSPDPEAPITVSGCDISSRDNRELAEATAAILPALTALRERRLIDDAELLRLVYRFAGESADVEEMLARGRKEAG